MRAFLSLVQSLTGDSLELTPARQRHARRTAILAGGVTLGTVLVVLTLLFSVGWLNEMRVIGFPLGFYLVAQGGFILAVAVAFYAARRQDQIDRAFDESEEL
jgi:putative solute:sodium symporter small subunit